MPRILSHSSQGISRPALNRTLVRSLLLAVALAGASSHAQAQIITDGTVGPGGILSGPNYHIPAELGRKLGPNLFHSFADFQLYAGESATFTGPASIRNILSRVTGGNTSLIDGQLNSNIAGANFFFINPAGTVFGPNAQVNVGGSFTVTSADVVKLGAGGSFNALDPAATVLTSAPPQAFGFLAPHPAPIGLFGTQLVGTPGQSVSLVGGDIQLQDGAALVALGGALNVVSVGSKGEVPLASFDPATPLDPNGFTKLGSIDVKNGSQIVGLGQNEIYLAGQNLTVDGAGSIITAENSAAPKGFVDIVLNGDLNISHGGVIQSAASRNSEGSDITIQANRVIMTGGSQLLSLNDSSAKGGDIAIGAGQVQLTDAQIASSAQGRGEGGDISVGADTIAIQGKTSDTGVFSLTSGGSRGGDIQIRGGNIQLVQAGISSGSQGGGHGGDIGINADTLVVDGQGNGAGGVTSKVFDTAQGGSINITARDLQVSNAGTISSDANDVSLGGNINITADKLTVSALGLDSIVQTQAFDGSRGGNIVIKGGQLRILANATVSTVTAGAGDAGNLTVKTEGVLLDGHNVRDAGGASGLFSQSVNDIGGAAGSIEVDTQDLQMKRGSNVSSTTFGSGAGGDITVKAKTVNIDGQESLTGIVAGAFQIPGGAVQSGRSGNINITADSLHLVGQGVVTASTAAAGNAGDITVTAKDIVLDGAKSVRSTGITSVSQDGATGNAGNIVITADNLSVLGSIAIASSTATTGDGGNITIKAKKIVLDSRDATDNGVNASSLAPVNGGASGIIDITADDLQVLGNASISSATVSSVPDSSPPPSTIVAADVPAAKISIKSKNILLDGRNSAQSRNILSNTLGLTGDPAGGDIFIKTDHLTMQNGAALTSDTGSSDPTTPSTGAGRGGTITIQGLSGAGAKTVDVNGGSFIASRTLGAGEGGSITITADALSLNGLGKSSEISADAINLNPGKGGNGGIITLNTGALTINQGQISTSSAKTSNPLAGTAGAITINADSLTLNKGFIAATADGEANAGDITITMGGTGNISLRDSSITAAAKRQKGGIINVNNAGDVTLVNSNFTTSARSGGGDINLHVGGNLNLTGSSTQAVAGDSTAPNAVGGNVNLFIGNGLRATGSGITAFATGDGGDVTLSAFSARRLSRYVVLDRSEVLANAINGTGGNISINSNIFIPSNDTRIDASSQFGVNGNVAIDSPNTLLGGSLVLLPTNLLGAENYLAERCVIRQTGALSSFTIAPLNGNPTQPGDLLPSQTP